MGCKKILSVSISILGTASLTACSPQAAFSRNASALTEAPQNDQNAPSDSSLPAPSDPMPSEPVALGKSIFTHTYKDLYRTVVSTGASTKVASFSKCEELDADANVYDIAATPSGQVFGLLNGQLYSINPKTGGMKLVPIDGIGKFYGEVKGYETTVNALTAISETELVVAGHGLGIINLGDRTASVLVPKQSIYLPYSSGDVAMMPNGKIYWTVGMTYDKPALNHDALWEIDRASKKKQNWRVVAKLKHHFVWGLANIGGVLTGFDKDGKIFDINTANGAETNERSTPIVMGSAESAIPDPENPGKTIVYGGSYKTLMKYEVATNQVIELKTFRICESLAADEDVYDIAKTPNGSLYALLDNEIYSVEPVSGELTHIAIEGIDLVRGKVPQYETVANALGAVSDHVLAIGGHGMALIDLNTKKASLIVPQVSIYLPYSAGDIAYLNGKLYWTVAMNYEKKSLNHDALWEVDPMTKARKVVGKLSYHDVWGLASVDGELIGFAQDGSIFKIDPATAVCGSAVSSGLNLGAE